MANLSNINNKFLVTTGGNVLIGQTSAVGSSIFQVTGTSTFEGNVGIGTNLPLKPLHVFATDGAGNIRLTRSGTSEYHDIGTYYSYTNGNSADFGTTSVHKTFLTTASYNALEINPQQEVSLLGYRGADGFALPQDQNTGYSNFSAGGFGILFRETRDNYILGNAYYYKTGGTAGWRAKYSAYGATLISSDGDLMQFQNAPAVAGGTNLTFTPRLNIIANGNVGIGTASPTKQLHLLRTTGDVRGIMVETTVATSYAEVQVKAASEFRIGTGGSSTVPNGQFYVYDATAGAHRFDIDANGNVGIGITSPDYGKLQIDNASGNTLTLRKGAGTPAVAYGGVTGNEAIALVEGKTGGGLKWYVGAGTLASPTWTAAMELYDQGRLHPYGGVFLGSSNNDQLLSYYKEGTWTPTLSFGGNVVGIVYGGAAGTFYRGGHYTRIGRIVTFSFRIILTSKGTSTGSATITGLPFIAANLPGNYGSAMYSFANNFLIPERPTITIDNNSSIIRLRFVNSPGGNYGNVTNSGFNNNSDIILTGTYQAAP